MREILFRAKVKDKEELLGKGFPIDENGNLKSEWVFGVPIPRYPDLFLAWNEACNEYEEVNIIPETITEYTGLIRHILIMLIPKTKLYLKSFGTITVGMERMSLFLMISIMDLKNILKSSETFTTIPNC